MCDCIEKLNEELAADGQSLYIDPAGCSVRVGLYGGQEKQITPDRAVVAALDSDGKPHLGSGVRYVSAKYCPWCGTEYEVTKVALTS